MNHRKLLTFLAVGMIIIFAAGSALSAELTLGETVQVWHQDIGGTFNVSVYPGKASYLGNDGVTAGTFGDGTVLDYRFFTTDSDTGVDLMTSYADGGAGVVLPVTSPDPATVNNGSENWPDVWTTSDPGASFENPADFTDRTLARAQNINGVIDISEMKYGTIYIIHGTYINAHEITLTMSGAGLEDIVATYSQGNGPNKNIIWITEYDFVGGDGYDTITYTYTNTDADASRARFAGVIVDGLTNKEVEVLYPKSGEVVPPGDVTLEWINIDDPCSTDPVYVEVAWGTDPNRVTGNYTQIAAGNDITTATISPAGPGVYYWYVDTTIGAGGADPCTIEGSVYMFTNDGPIESVSLSDMVTWSGEPVGLAADVTDDGGSPLAYAWSIDNIPSGVTAVFDPSADVANPAVTFTMESYTTANIINPSFETDVLADGTQNTDTPTGWTKTGYGGLWNPDDVGGTAPAFGGVVPDGENCLWVNNGISASQVLTDTFQEGASYTLTVDVGLNKDWGTGARYSVELLAGGTVIAEDINSETIALGTFETSVVNYTYDVADANKIGLPLEIRLACISTEAPSTDAEFDNVVLTSDIPFPAPETATVDVTATVVDATNPAVSGTATIDIYPDSCTAARIGLGMDIPGDITENCLVNPEDLAIMAELWLDDGKNLDTAVANPGNNSAGNVFSVNFYRAWPAWQDTAEERNAVLLQDMTGDADPKAGFGDWNTNGWLDFNVGWAQDGNDETPDTITSTGGNTASFYLHDTRNGNTYNENLGAMVEGANGEMMEGHGNGTLENAANPDKIFHIELADIPFAAYEVIFYIGTQEAQQGDGSGKYVINNGPEKDFQLRTGSIAGDSFRFDGTFEQVNKGDGVERDGVGNYILIEGLTGSSLDLKMWGNGFNHIGMSGFQVREKDPNAPVVSAGDSMITWLGEPATLTGTVDGTGSLWNMEGLTYSWSSSADNDPKVDAVFSNPADLSTTVTITKVPYLDPYVTNGSFEQVTSQQWIDSSRDSWGHYDRPAGTNKSALQYVPNATYHFPEDENTPPDGNIICRASSATDESRPDGPAILLDDVLYDPTATYELSVAVGHPFASPEAPNPGAYDENTWRGYLVQLVVGGQVESTGSGPDNVYGGTVVAEDANSIDIPAREWRTSVITLGPSPELDHLAGEPIQIRLLTPDDPDPAYATTTKVFFDNAVLTINGEAGVYVIDPAAPSVNAALTVEEAGTGNTVSALATIDVYDTPCDAAVAADPEFEYDLSDFTEDCITNMSDLAIFAEDWMLDYALMGAEAK